jgi:hypothetical protein
VVNQLLGRRVGALSLPYGSDVLTQAVAAIVPDHWFADETMDKLVMRFDERSVGVENRLLRARSTMDRLVPWIALALLALGLVAVWVAAKYSV